MTACDCKRMSKIFKGKAANIGEFPHHVSVQYSEHHICGGSIISSNHVLTAANCIVLDLNVVTGNLKVLAGTGNRRDETTNTGTYHNVKYIIYHPEYSPKLFWKNDIAILTLETPIILNGETRDSVALAGSILLPGTIVRICGWRHDSISTVRHGWQLQQLRLQIDDIVFCMEHFKGIEISVSQRCATPTVKSADITLGNGGGGMIRQRKLVGIISVLFGIKSKSTIFTQIYPFYNAWIQYIISNY
ncbi:hypothetical protein HCN44_011281 [Aphidius gifuensis]|uniref:Peptidase S1 domain-containing protein n=1 Tax=Aphidius gifuensis TaxID=684658 RepID=A0A834XYG9_APHGI|nr:trypsin zeta-like [Aphidius gifuensis]KAF7994012.1 hypothetical protein HCN44_011281 [Aphidius gifuensis]